MRAGTWLLALGCWAALGGCGGERGTLKVKIKTPPGADDPFLQAVQVRMTVGERTAVAPVMAGRFSVQIEVDEPDREQPVRLVLEALDAGGQVVGRGRTPSFVLLPQNSEITVYVGRPGRVTPTEVQLLDAEQRPAGRADLAGASLRGRGTERALGALVVGGVNAAGHSEPSAWLYDPMTHALVAAGRPQKARRGAVLVPSADGDVGQQAILWGGALVAGGAELELPTAAEVFDPAMPSLATVFSSPAPEVAEAGPPGAVGATVAEVQPGLFVASGGRQRKAQPAQPDQPINQAVLLQRVAAPEGAADRRARPGVQRLGGGAGGPMVAARYGHTATPVSLPEGPGLLLFGGLGDGVQEPAAEEFSLSQRQFRAVPLFVTQGDRQVPVPSRRGHVAAPLRDGRVLVLGGVEAGQSRPQDSGLLIEVRSRQVQPLPGWLAVARQGAAVSVVGDEIAVCGGLGPEGQVLASCEFFAVESGQRSRPPVPMPTARAGHVQLALETDQVLLVGGFGEGGQLPAAIDLLTPLR
ncbi:MAG: hypothetical protein RMK29_08435 [Myxococcales bacterium]|nr:hypothetical protein [Myxococcota bacterium]MDW8281722.1 hypothetical protein [Myxococcales bacterium]